MTLRRGGSSLMDAGRRQAFKAALVLAGLAGAGRALGAEPAKPANTAARLALPYAGLCVSNMERALRFYVDVLGFKQEEAAPGSPPAAMVGPLLGMTGDFKLRAIHLEREGFRLEMLEFSNPPASGDGKLRPVNQLGLTHIKVNVANLDEVLKSVTAHGGTVLESTRIPRPGGGFLIFITDPDGTRIQLIEVKPAAA